MVKRIFIVILVTTAISCFSSCHYCSYKNESWKINKNFWKEIKPLIIDSAKSKLLYSGAFINNIGFLTDFNFFDQEYGNLGVLMVGIRVKDEIKPKISFVDSTAIPGMCSREFNSSNLPGIGFSENGYLDFNHSMNIIFSRGDSILNMDKKLIEIKSKRANISSNFDNGRIITLLSKKYQHYFGVIYYKNYLIVVIFESQDTKAFPIKAIYNHIDSSRFVSLR